MDSDSEAETLAKQISETLPSNSAIPKKLMNVIWKATEKEQSKRYQTALEFKKAINNALLPDPPLSTRFFQWIQNHIVVLVSIVVAIAFIIFFIVLFYPN